MSGVITTVGSSPARSSEDLPDPLAPITSRKGTVRSFVVARAIAADRQARFADVIELAFELEHGSMRAVPRSIARQPLYERNPVRFWQVVAALLTVALVVALSR